MNPALVPPGFIYVTTCASDPSELVQVSHIVRVVPRNDNALLVLHNDDRLPIIESVAVVAERIDQAARPLRLLEAPTADPRPKLTQLTPVRSADSAPIEAPHEDPLQPLRKTRVPTTSPPTPCARQLSTDAGPCFIEAVWRRRLGPYESAAEACGASLRQVTAGINDLDLVTIRDADNGFIQLHPENRQ